MASEVSLPRLVSVKRKRDAESVDVLFVQEGKQAKRAKTPFIFKRVEKLQNKTSGNQQQNGPDATQRPQTPRDKPRTIIKPREFHLERPSVQSSVAKKAQGSNGRPGKSAQQKRLAVLVETSVKRQAGSVEDLVALARGRPVQQSLPPSPIKKPLLDAPKQQLKPRASAAELRWREEKWGPRGAASRSVSRGPTPSASDTEDLKLAEKLDAFAREQDSKLSQQQTSDMSPRKRPLKFQPRAAAAGRKQPTAMQNDSPASNMSDGESDYEYDTYERVPYVESQPDISGQADLKGMDVDMAANDPALAGKSIGVLVIADEDEDLWATYQETEDSDEEFETDDEDENAEDYYGNDYPEDELDSEDEYNRGAYGFRSANSDDEQWGDGMDDDDDGGISDDEQPRRRQPAGQASGSWANEFASPVQNRGLDPY